MSEKDGLDSLWVAARRGERAAFAALVTALHPAIFRIVLGIVGDYQDAEDVTQEVFLRAHLALRKLKQSAELDAWLRRIAINAAIDRLRRRRRQRWWPWASRPLTEDLPERPRSPEDALVEQVRRALQKLPEHYRVGRTAGVGRAVLRRNRPRARLPGRHRPFPPGAGTGTTEGTAGTILPRETLTMKCRQARLLLSQHLDGELDRPSAEVMQRHVRACPDCRAYQGQLSQMRELVQASAVASPPADLPDRIRARLGERVRGREWVETEAWCRRLVPVAAAALVVFALLAFFWPAPESHVGRGRPEVASHEEAPRGTPTEADVRLSSSRPDEVVLSLAMGSDLGELTIEGFGLPIEE